MRKSYKKHKKRFNWLWLIIGIPVFFGVLIALLAAMDIACDLVASEARDAVKNYLQADLKFDQVSGNPLRGYSIRGANIKKDGAEMLKAELVEAKVNFMSLLSSPRLSLLSIGGVDVNLDKLAEELSKLPSQPSDGPFQVPIDELKIVQSVLTSKWGVTEIENVSLGFDQYTVTANVKANVNALPVAGIVAAEINGNKVTLKNVALNVGKGSVKASGQLSDALNLEGILEGMDVTELVSLWPDLSPGDYVGEVGMSFKAEGTWEDPSFTATANFKGARVAGWPVESFEGMVNYKELRLSLDKITANAFGIPIAGNLAMAFRNDVPTVFVKLSGGAADLAALSSLGGADGISGNISDFSIDINGATNALHGTIALHAPSVGAWGVKGTDIALQVKLTGGDQATVNGKAHFEGAASYLSGSVSDILTAPKLNVTLKTVDLNLASLKPFIPDADKMELKGNVTAEVHVAGSTSNPSLDGTISSKSLSATGYTVDNLALGFTYAGGNFTLKESSASWTGLPIKASGTVKNVTGAKPALDVNASLSLTPAALAKFVPDIVQYKLKGTVQVGVHASGAMPDPKLDLVISSQELAVMDMINAKNIKATTALTGDLANLDNMDLEVGAESVSASGLGFQNVNVVVKKAGDTINLVTAKASSGQGSISGSGKLTIPKSGAGDINISVEMAQLNLSDLSKTGNLGVALAGTFSGKLALTGKADSPNVAFQGSAPKFSAEGYGMDNLTVELSGNMDDLKLDNLSAQIGAGKLSATGSFKPSEGKGQIEFTGSGLDLAKLTESVPDVKGQIAGTLSAKFSASLSGAEASGQGSASIPSLVIYGMKLSDVAIPLSLSGSSLKYGHGTAKLNGGSLELDGDFNTQTFKYSGKLNASGVDVNALVHDLVPDIKGKITGKGELALTFNGTIDPKFTLGGTGTAKVGTGGLSGFSWLDIISKLHGTDSVHYAEVTAPFKLETTRIIFQKGSKATAPGNDPLYKYAQIEGPITYAGGFNLTGDGSVNFLLINIITGGALGAAGAIAGGNIGEFASGKGLEAVLSQAIGKGAAAGKQSDFREVSFKVGGNIDDPSFSIVKVGQPSAEHAETSEGDAQKQPQSIQEAVKDKVLDSIGIPGVKKEEASSASGAGSTSGAQGKQATPAPAKEAPKKPGDVVKEEAGKAIKNIFNKK
ncbi:MAG: hypothetical protein FWF87_01605 [Synergistaceae bacterium]|nr:hypothetical protein [Synergistaceae bacterium]